MARRKKLNVKPHLRRVRAHHKRHKKNYLPYITRFANTLAVTSPVTVLKRELAFPNPILGDQRD